MPSPAAAPAVGANGTGTAVANGETAQLIATAPINAHGGTGGDAFLDAMARYHPKTLAAKLRGFLDSPIWSAIIVLGTVWALYSSDFTFLVLPKSSDTPIAIVSIFVTVIFSAEIVLNFVSKRDYGREEGCNRLNLFFWLDLFGTASLIPEILIMLGSDIGAPKAAAIARAGRAARIGARMTRIVRFVRDRHLVCGSKEGKKFCRFERLDELSATQAASKAMLEQLGGEQDQQYETEGAKISEIISKRVIMLVLFIIIVTPPLTYFVPPGQVPSTIHLAPAPICRQTF